jgi:hypothetical protein
MAKKKPTAAPETPKTTGFKGADYNAVAMAARLESIRLIAQRFDVNPECEEPSKWKLEYGRKVMACSFDADAGFVAGIIRYEVTGRQGRKRAFRCMAEYGIMYSIPSEADEEAALGFCQYVGSFAIYPYFRALVAQLAWNAELLLPPLPSIASTAHIPPKPAKNDVQFEAANA